MATKFLILIALVQLTSFAYGAPDFQGDDVEHDKDACVKVCLEWHKLLEKHEIEKGQPCVYACTSYNPFGFVSLEVMKSSLASAQFYDICLRGGVDKKACRERYIRK